MASIIVLNLCNVKTTGINQNVRKYQVIWLLGSPSCYLVILFNHFLEYDHLFP
jgi:hypothetical protein